MSQVRANTYIRPIGDFLVSVLVLPRNDAWIYEALVENESTGWKTAWRENEFHGTEGAAIDSAMDMARRKIEERSLSKRTDDEVRAELSKLSLNELLGIVDTHFDWKDDTQQEIIADFYQRQDIASELIKVREQPISIMGVTAISAEEVAATAEIAVVLKDGLYSSIMIRPTTDVDEFRRHLSDQEAITAFVRAIERRIKNREFENPRQSFESLEISAKGPSLDEVPRVVVSPDEKTIICNWTK